MTSAGVCRTARREPSVAATRLGEAGRPPAVTSAQTVRSAGSGRDPETAHSAQHRLDGSWSSHRRVESQSFERNVQLVRPDPLTGTLTEHLDSCTTQLTFWTTRMPRRPKRQMTATTS